jgi:DDB1- and CUL4-associated factor 6
MANIFSVKFMPHSNDRTVVTAAGDSEVRVFDIEYSGRSVPASTPATLASSGRSRGLNNVYNGVRFLSDGDTNARIYRSHSDRVKRISHHPFMKVRSDLNLLAHLDLQGLSRKTAHISS